jgi:hypothetical protein
MTTIQHNTASLTSSNQSAALDQLQDTTSRQFETLKSMIEGIVPSMQREYRSQLEEKGRDNKDEINIKTIIVEVKETIVKMFNMMGTMVVTMQANLPLQVQRQQPVYFIDACGFEAPFHLEFINSWEAFEAVLEVRFKDRGLSKIKRREYTLEKAGNHQLISRSTPWERRFLPGMKIVMDMVFRVRFQQANACPSCGYHSDEPVGTEIDWLVKLVFSSIN